MRLRRPRDGNHTLRRNPRKRNLRCFASLTLSQFLDLGHDGFVLIEVLALEFGNGTTEVVRGKIIRRVVLEVVYEPAMAEGAVRYVGYVQLFACVDQAICLMQCFES